MRKIIFLLALLQLFQNQIQAQSYTPFPTDSATWLVVFHIGYGSGYSSYAETQYMINGTDTLYNGLTYKKIIYREAYGGGPYPIAPPPSPPIANAPDKYMGAVRENANREVYFLDTLGVERMVLDFDINLYNGYFPWMSYCPISISAIDSVWVVNDYRKRYTYTSVLPCSFPSSPPWNQYIEGIGYHNGGLFENSNRYRYLACFQWKGQTLYSRYNYNQQVAYGPGASCHQVYPYGTTLSSQTILKETVSINIYPNPIESELYIENQSKKSNCSVRIYDLSGQLLMDRNVNDFLTVLTEDWISGLYVVVVFDEKGNLLIQKKIQKKL